MDATDLLKAFVSRLQSIASEAIASAFFGVRHRGGDRVLLKLSVAVVAILALTWGPFFFFFRADLSALANVYVQMVTALSHGGARPDPSELPPGTPVVLLFAIVILIIQYIAVPAYEAGCLRWMIRGEVEGFWGLSLGAETWRVWSTYWIWAGFNIAASIVIAAITYIINAASGDDPSAGEPARLAWLVVQNLIILFFAVRLAPAAATSIGRKRFSFFEAWRVTSGRFSPMLGAFLILVVLLYAVAVVTVGGALVVVYGPSASHIVAAAEGRDVETMVTLLAAPLKSAGSLSVLLLALLVNQALSMVFYVLFFGVNARAVMAASVAGKIDGVTMGETAKAAL